MRTSSQRQVFLIQTSTMSYGVQQSTRHSQLQQLTLSGEIPLYQLLKPMPLEKSGAHGSQSQSESETQPRASRTRAIVPSPFLLYRKTKKTKKPASGQLPGPDATPPNGRTVHKGDEGTATLTMATCDRRYEAHLLHCSALLHCTLHTN